ncbi:hypothetical protein N9V92_06185 [Luminiphilus sp.]|nr:hypothetical protein [Luminiphilus sp.]
MDEEDAFEKIMTLTNKANVTARDKVEIQKLSKWLTPEKQGWIEEGLWLLDIREEKDDGQQD